MVALHHHDFASAQVGVNMGGHMPEISEPDEAASGREQIAIRAARKGKSHRLLRIVRHREALDLQVAKGETRAALENPPAHRTAELGTHRPGSGFVGEN